MKADIRRDLAFLVQAVGAAVLVAAHFFSGAASLAVVVALVAVGLALVAAGALIAPPFWWGRRSFTTPLKDPSHEARQKDET